MLTQLNINVSKSFLDLIPIFMTESSEEPSFQTSERLSTHDLKPFTLESRTSGSLTSEIHLLDEAPLDIVNSTGATVFYFLEGLEQVGTSEPPTPHVSDHGIQLSPNSKHTIDLNMV
jgi:hypothetical protein